MEASRAVEDADEDFETAAKLRGALEERQWSAGAARAVSIALKLRGDELFASSVTRHSQHIFIQLKGVLIFESDQSASI